MLYSITGVVDPLPTATELYGSDDALPHNLGLKGAAAKAAAAAVFPTPLHSDILDLLHSVPIVDLFLPGFHEDFMMGGRGGGGHCHVHRGYAL